VVTAGDDDVGLQLERDRGDGDAVGRGSLDRVAEVPLRVLDGGLPPRPIPAHAGLVRRRRDDGHVVRPGERVRERPDPGRVDPVVVGEKNLACHGFLCEPTGENAAGTNPASTLVAGGRHAGWPNELRAPNGASGADWYLRFGGHRNAAGQSAVTGWRDSAIANTSSKKPSESCGPGFASGWY